MIRTRRWTRLLAQAAVGAAVCLLISLGGASRATAACTAHPVTYLSHTPYYPYIFPQTWMDFPVYLWAYNTASVAVTYRTETGPGDNSCYVGVRFANPSDATTYGMMLTGDGSGGVWGNWGYVGSVASGQTVTNNFQVFALRSSGQPGAWVPLQIFVQRSDAAGPYNASTTAVLSTVYVWVYNTP